jgi:archaellum biogenesis ATPase FlaH
MKTIEAMNGNMNEKKKQDITANTIFAEKALLSSIISLKYLNKTRNELTPADFYDSKNGEIFKAMLKFEKDNSIMIEDLVIMLGNEYDSILTELIMMQAYDFWLYFNEVKKYSKERQKAFYIQEYQNGKISDIDFVDKFKKLNDLSETEKINEYSFLDNINITGEQVFISGLPVGCVSVAVGAGGIGKTYMALKLALDAEKKGKRTLCWLTEDSKFQIRDRLKFLSKVYSYNINKNTKGTIKYDIPEALLEKNYSTFAVNLETQAHFKKLFADYDFIIIDPLMNFLMGENNNNDANRLFINSLSKCISEKQALLILHHVNKFKVELPSSESIKEKKLNAMEIEDRLLKIKGANSINETGRHILYIESHRTKNNERIMSVIKSNVGKTGGIVETVILPDLPKSPDNQVNVNAIEEKTKYANKDDSPEIWA